MANERWQSSSEVGLVRRLPANLPLAAGHEFPRRRPQRSSPEVCADTQSHFPSRRAQSSVYRPMRSMPAFDRYWIRAWMIAKSLVFAEFADARAFADKI